MAGWLSACAWGNVKSPQKRRKQGRKPVPQGATEIGGWVLAVHFFLPKKGGFAKDFLTHRLGPRLPCKRLLGLLQHIPGV